MITRWSEITLLIVGILLTTLTQPQTAWKGLGVGLIIQVVLLLLIDYYDEKRGAEYLEFLKNFRL